MLTSEACYWCLMVASWMCRLAGGVGDSEGRIKTQQNRKRKNGKNGKVSLVHNWGLTTVMGQYGLLSAIEIEVMEIEFDSHYHTLDMKNCWNCQSPLFRINFK